jgi:hypothetical protein
MIRHGSHAWRKAVAQSFVERLLVQVPGVIQPTLLVRGGLPAQIAEGGAKAAPEGASRAVTSAVGRRHSYSNLDDIRQRLTAALSGAV